MVAVAIGCCDFTSASGAVSAAVAGALDLHELHAGSAATVRVTRRDTVRVYVFVDRAMLDADTRRQAALLGPAQRYHHATCSMTRATCDLLHVPCDI